MKNLQYDYDYGPDGPLAPLHARAEYPESPVMISPPLGWVPLVLQLNEDLAAILPNYTIAQVKEKFAELRYYLGEYGVGKDDPRVTMARDFITEAERTSQRICQVCGAPGRIHDGRAWLATLCDEHIR